MIQLLTQPEPTVDRRIQAELDGMYPRVFLRWDSRHALLDGKDQPFAGVWEPRWELWVELVDSAHPGIRARIHGINDKDLWNSEAGCFMRFLQSYENADGSFAPVDERLLIGLELADTWKNRRFYEEHIEDPWDREDQARMRINQDALGASARYYRKFENPIVGRHFNSGWRGKLGLY